MKTLKVISTIADCKEAYKKLVVADSFAKEDAWFYNMSEEKQREYLRDHKHSKFSKNAHLKQKALEDQKAITTEAPKPVQKMSDAIKDFNDEQKAFFKKGSHKAGSEDRRNTAQLVKDKAKGIVTALKGEGKEWKTAAGALRKLKKGESLDKHDKAALKAIAMHTGIVAGEIALTGGLAHGIAVALPHLASGMLSHSLAINFGKAAAYASIVEAAKDDVEQSDDELLEELVHMFAKGVEDAPMKSSHWIEAIKKHNAKKGKQVQK